MRAEPRTPGREALKLSWSPARRPSDRPGRVAHHPASAWRWGLRHHRGPLTLLLTLIVAAIMMSSPVVASSSGAGSPWGPSPSVHGAGISSGGGYDCGAPSRVASALDILQPNPIYPLLAGAKLNASYEYEAVNYTAADQNITVYVPVSQALFPLASGPDASVALPAGSTLIGQGGWSTPVNATLTEPTNQTFTASPLAGLYTEGYYNGSQVSDAVQAAAPYGNLTLAFRWSWTLTEPNGTTYAGAWTVPSASSSYPALPSVFEPAPLVQSVANSANNSAKVAMGDDFIDDISGYVANTTFTLSFQTSTGAVIASVGLTTAAHPYPYVNASIPIVSPLHALSAGSYIFHVTDRCGALVQDIWFVVVYPTTTDLTVGISPSACGPILFDGSREWNSSLVVNPSTGVQLPLTAPACSGLGFEEWTSTGGVLPLTMASNRTTVLVSWNGTLEAVYGIPNAVTFDESGLASNGTWTVTLGSLTHGEHAGSSISFVAGGGTYDYSVGSDLPGLATPSHGQVTFAGTLLTVNVTFSPLNITHTVVIILENQDLGTILQYAPYEDYLWNTYGEATNFYPWCHPSLPNYYAITAGRFGECGLNDGVGIPPSNDTDLPDVLQAAGETWGGYFESMPSPCDTTWLGTIYDPWHNPFLVSNDIVMNASRCDSHVVNSDVFNASVANGTLPNFSFYVPNTQDDCEYAVLRVCDDWLKGFLPPILNSTRPAEENLVNHTAFFILYDEGLTNLGASIGGLENTFCTNYTGLQQTTCGGHSYLVVVSPYSHGDVYTTNSTGFNVAETIEWLLGVGNCGGFDASPDFPPMESLFEPAGPTTNDVTVTETGLPAGTQWWANLTDAETFTSTSDTLVFSEPDGSYAYGLASTDKALPGPMGNFTVDGFPVLLAANFSSSTYRITFTESGLPAGANWWLNLTNGRSFNSTGSRISFRATNGTYDYALGTSSKIYTSPSGSFTVSGGKVTDTVVFAPYTYAVTFQESGLPSGTSWWVNYTNGSSYGSTGSHLTTNATNGTYAYSLSTSLKTYSSPSGSFVVLGANVSKDAVFSPYTFTIAFDEGGLPSDTEWWVNLTGGQSYGSTGSYRTFAETNGSYSYAIGTSLKTYSAPGGAFTVDGANVTEDVAFSPYTYAVEVSESGLPVGTLWWTNLTDGRSFAPTSSNLWFTATNGSYDYTLGTSLKTFSAHGGSFIVDGSNASVAVLFQPYVFPVSVMEIGLPQGTAWWLNLTNGQSFESTGPLLAFYETNGTYSDTAGTTLKTYAAPGGAFTVQGANGSIVVVFSPYVFVVAFDESGLPSGTPWWVNLSEGESFRSTGVQIAFNETNGTYGYVLGTTLKTYGSPPGTLVVGGQGVSRSVGFTPETYPVTFGATGLPPGTSWWVDLPLGATPRSTNATLTVLEVNGSYPYTIGSSDSEYAAPGGTFSVAGVPVTEAVAFRAVAFAVTFTEQGLPYGSAWWINVTGHGVFRGTGKVVSFVVPNGSYAFTVATTDKDLSGLAGNFVVAGQPLNLTTPFESVLFDVNFLETGLPAGTRWTIALDGAMLGSESNAIAFAESNDSYGYTVGGVQGYFESPSLGSVRVNGVNETISVDFRSEGLLAPVVGGNLLARALASIAVGILIVLVAIVIVQRYRAGRARGRTVPSTRPGMGPT
jgi:Phosphoesterase family